MTHDRRTVLASLGLALPFGLDRLVAAAPAGPAPVLRLRSFEEAVRAAFGPDAHATVSPVPGESLPCRRIEVGHSAEVLAGVQGCHNDRPFAGFPAGGLRIVRSGSAPGPLRDGVRLYVATVDVARVSENGPDSVAAGRPLDFATLPAAPVLA